MVPRNRVRHFRKSHLLTLEQLAELTGLSPQFLSEIERRRKMPSVRVMRRIALAFGTTPARVFPFLGSVPTADRDAAACAGRSIRPNGGDGCETGGTRHPSNHAIGNQACPGRSRIPC